MIRQMTIEDCAEGVGCRFAKVGVSSQVESEALSFPFAFISRAISSLPFFSRRGEVERQMRSLALPSLYSLSRGRRFNLE